MCVLSLSLAEQVTIAWKFLLWTLLEIKIKFPSVKDIVYTTQQIFIQIYWPTSLDTIQPQKQGISKATSACHPPPLKHLGCTLCPQTKKRKRSLNVENPMMSRASGTGFENKFWKQDLKTGFENQLSKIYVQQCLWIRWWLVGWLVATTYRVYIFRIFKVKGKNLDQLMEWKI